MQITSVPQTRLESIRPPRLEEAPSAPADDGVIDFSTIDSEQKAALLPALNGASLAVMMSTLQAEAKWNVMVTSLQQETLNDAMGASIRCQGASSDGSTVSLSGSGMLGEVPIEETWTLDKDNGVLLIEGTIGYSHESLVLHGAEDGTQVLEGTIGDVAVHEVLRRGDGEMHLDGTLNGVAHHQSMKIDESRMPLAPPLVFTDVIVVSGSLGDAPIELAVDAVCPQHVPAITYAGRGSIAGVAVESNHTLQITPLG